MEPTLRDGDRLLVRLRGRSSSRADRRRPVADGVLAVKRLDHLAPEGWWVQRDNPREGRDSWSAGAVPEADVLALVLARVWPRPGLLAGTPRPGPG